MMDFYEVLEQVIELLQRHRRVSYRALKRQFDLDDADLDDLKWEIVKIQQLAVEQDGDRLVWTGNAAAPEVGAGRLAEAENRFYVVFRAISGLLQGQRRVTYRELKNLFDLDDGLLEEIRDELRLRRLAIDEEGKVLVRVGESLYREQPATDHQMDRPATSLQNGSTEGLADDELTALDPMRGAPEAERRQLTVMFCDLVGSTDLSGKLDPEDLREIVRAYQATAAEVVDYYEGHIAQYLGDGLLIYFGYPVAHEDDAARAVHTGLGIVNAMGALNTRLNADYGVALAVRIGIHTGPVVIGEMGGGGRHENLALGETPNIAARLEGLAESNTVVVSPVTARLVERLFLLEEQGPYALKGVSEPMVLACVMGPVEAESLAPAGLGFNTLVGRDEEIGLLQRRWEQSKAGLGQVVLLSGEAGIGKSSLVEGLWRHVRQEGHTHLAFRCSPYHTHSTLYPIIDTVQRSIGWQPGDSGEAKLAKLEQAVAATRLAVDETVPVLAALLSLSLPEGRYPDLASSPQLRRQQTHDTVVAWLLEATERHPVLAVWEDLHWADPSTLDILGLLVDQAPTAPLLNVLTFRPEFVSPWSARSHITPISLNRLERPQVESLISHLTGGKPLPTEVVEHLVAKTDGVPLYVEELTKMLLMSDLLREGPTDYELTGPLNRVAIPDTLQDSLMARLDQFTSAKEIAQLGAVLGREFPYAMLQALSRVAESRLQEGLAQLVKAELLYQRGRPPRAIYIFKHALIQDAAYQSLLKTTQQHLHHQVAELLATQFPEIAAAQPDLVARHYMAAGLYESALVYWQQGGKAALERSAYQETVACFEQALDALHHLPESPNPDYS